MIQIPEYHDGFVIRIEGSMVKIITIIHYIHSSFGELDIDISIWDGDEVGNDAKWGSILFHLEPLHNLCHHHVQLHLGKPPANAGPEQKSSVQKGLLIHILLANLAPWPQGMFAKGWAECLSLLSLSQRSGMNFSGFSKLQESLEVLWPTLMTVVSFGTV